MPCQLLSRFPGPRGPTLQPCLSPTGRHPWHHRLLPDKVTPPGGNTRAQAVPAPRRWGLSTPACPSHHPQDCLGAMATNKSPHTWPLQLPLEPFSGSPAAPGHRPPKQPPVWTTFPSRQPTSPPERFAAPFTCTHGTEVPPHPSKPAPAPHAYHSAHPTASYASWESFLFYWGSNLEI